MEKTDSEKTCRLHVAVTPRWLRRVDDWRREQDDLPTVAESLRRLVEIGIDASTEKSHPAIKRRAR